jgi:hypothetical protein
MQSKIILRIDRERNSGSGNPRFRFTFTDGTMAKSSPNAGWAYAVGNRWLREGSSVSIELNKRGDITNVREAT